MNERAQVTATNCPVIPLGDMVCLRIQRVDASKGGIVLPQNIAKENDAYTPMCEVLAIGPECKRVSVGQMVLYPVNMPAQPVECPSVARFVMVHECDILGVLK
jgi:co-chaperonin GroES (HSP10)